MSTRLLWQPLSTMIINSYVKILLKTLLSYVNHVQTLHQLIWALRLDVGWKRVLWSYASTSQVFLKMNKSQRQTGPSTLLPSSHQIYNSVRAALMYLICYLICYFEQHMLPSRCHHLSAKECKTTCCVYYRPAALVCPK